MYTVTKYYEVAVILIYAYFRCVLVKWSAKKTLLIIAAAVLLVFMGLYTLFGAFMHTSLDSQPRLGMTQSTSLSLEIPPNTLSEVHASVRMFLQQHPSSTLVSESTTINDRTARAHIEFTVHADRADEVLDSLRSYGRVTSFHHSTRYQSQGTTADPSVVTARLTIAEREGIFAGISRLSIPQLLSILFTSAAALIWFVFAILPWVILGSLIWYGVRLYNKRSAPPKKKG